MIFHDIIIVGGGASGLMAAIVAKDKGKDVAIIESTDRIGKKILTTGNGRCNISNINIKEPFNCYTSENPHFFDECLKSFSVEETKNFFLYLGLPIIELEKGKLFPQSLQASSVVDILKLAIEEREIPLYTNCKVNNILKKKSFQIATNSLDFPLFKANKVVLSSGGKSASKTGSDGSGYKLAQNLSHNIVKPTPGIVQLKLDYPHLKGLSGIKFNGNVSALIDNEIVRKDYGEVLFTDYGISGPPILQLSALCSKALNNKKNVELIVNMMPDKTLDEISNFIEGHLSIFSHRPISTALIGVINKKLIPILLKDAGITNIHIPCYELTWKDRQNIIDRLTNWKFKCTDTNGFNAAQLTVGGIDTKEVNNKTLESKLVKNLYFTGEILDVNGDCGGFNLQWAWSSGYCVGNNV